MIIPKYGTSRLTNERVEVIDLDFDIRCVYVEDERGNKYILTFKDIDFNYANMDLDDMYVFLRELYPPREVVQKLCEARGLK